MDTSVATAARLRARASSSAASADARLRAGLLNAVCSDELLRQQRLNTLQVIVGMLELRFQPGDLGVGDNGIHLTARDISRGGVELGLGFGNAGHSRGGAILQAIDFRTGQSSKLARARSSAIS